MSEKRDQLVSLAAELAADFATRAGEHDRDNSFPVENVAKMKAAGYTALVIPEKHGGLGADLGGLLSINPGYSLDNLAYFLIVVAVGGLGSIRGPFVAALLIGVADTGFKYLLPEFGAFFIYALPMMILLWRPSGFFGRV